MEQNWLQLINFAYLMLPTLFSCDRSAAGSCHYSCGNDRKFKRILGLLGSQLANGRRVDRLRRRRSCYQPLVRFFLNPEICLETAGRDARSIWTFGPIVSRVPSPRLKEVHALCPSFSRVERFRVHRSVDRSVLANDISRYRPPRKKRG